MKPINILFIEYSVGLGGSTMSLCSLLNFLDDELVEPHIVVSRNEQEAYLLGQLRRPGDITVITPRSSPSRAPWLQRILRFVDRRTPWLRHSVLRLAAVLEVFSVSIPYALQLRRWAKGRKIALIHQNNGFDLGALLLSYMLWVPLVAFQRGDEWNSLLVRTLAPRVTRYVANSAVTRRNLISIGVRPRQVSVIYPPLDLSIFDMKRQSRLTRSAFGVPASSPCFGIVGMLMPWKGQDVFLRAARRVLEKVPDAYAFVVGGVPAGGRDYETALHSLAADLGIADRLVFTGYRADLPDILKVLDVVAHASVQPEPFGRVIVEAMAMGRPVVASNAGGPTEIIDDGQTGFLVPPHDDEALATRIVELLQDPTMAERIGEAGRRAAVEKFSAESHVRLVKEVYAKLLGPRWASPASQRLIPHVRPTDLGP